MNPSLTGGTVMRLMQRLFDMTASMLETEGRELRDQVYRVCLSLIILCVAILFAIAGTIIGGVAAYHGLRNVMGPAQALGVLTLAVLVIAAVLIVAGCRVYPGHKSQEKSAEEQLEKDGPSLYQGNEARPLTTWSQATADTPPVLPGPYGGPSAMHASPMDTMHRTVEQSKDLIRKHPVAAAGVAFGLGMIVSRSSMARSAVKLGAIWGGRQLIDRFVFHSNRSSW